MTSPSTSKITLKIIFIQLSGCSKTLPNYQNFVESRRRPFEQSLFLLSLGDSFIFPTLYQLHSIDSLVSHNHLFLVNEARTTLAIFFFVSAFRTLHIYTFLSLCVHVALKGGEVFSCDKHKCADLSY